MKPLNLDLSLLRNIFFQVDSSPESAYPYRFKCKFCRLFIQSKLSNPFANVVLARITDMWNKTDKGKHSAGTKIRVDSFNPEFASGILYTENHKNVVSFDADSIRGERLVYFSSLPIDEKHYFLILVTKED